MKPTHRWTLIVPVAALPGADEIRALAAAYPDRIDGIDVVDGEWALSMDDEWFWWADGRLLPEDLRPTAPEFASIRFYRYELGPLRVSSPSADQIEALERRTRSQTDGETDTRERFNGFLDRLYSISTRADAETIVEPTRFLGLATRVHPFLVEPLQRVERDVRARIPYDPQVASFVDGLASIHGYNWRPIAGTVGRSYHSYGVAIDLVPYSYAGRSPYWLWAAQAGIERWWEIPLENRWQVPQPIIDAFEAHGFVWGGKWLFFDALHFEYRLESILLAEWRPPS